MRKGLRGFARMLAVLLGLSVVGGAAQAQEAFPLYQPGAGIAVLSQEDLFEGSAFGRGFLSDLQERSEALRLENAEIDAMLEQEELALTEARATLEGAVFRAQADAFDTRVNELRLAQEAKRLALLRLRDEARQYFFTEAYVHVEALIEARGIALVLHPQAVLMATSVVDLTQEAIDAVDAHMAYDPAVMDALVPAQSGAAPLAVTR